MVSLMLIFFSQSFPADRAPAFSCRLRATPLSWLALWLVHLPAVLRAFWISASSYFKVAVVYVNLYTCPKV